MKGKVYEEVEMKHALGLPMLLLGLAMVIAGTVLFAFGIGNLRMLGVFGWLIAVIGAVGGWILPIFVFVGLKVLQPNEALVLTLFGKYVGTLKGAGFYFVNPFTSAVNPDKNDGASINLSTGKIMNNTEDGAQIRIGASKKISLKASTLSNDQQKINDQMGNPIIIGVVIIWKVVNAAKAVFDVDNYKEFLSIQCDSALRNIVRLYPYDSAKEEENEKTLRGSSQEIAENLKNEIQRKVDIAGLEIIEARITNLAYAPEIAAAMLQRQQASAIIDAKQMIVEGAVGMVEMALGKLHENDIVQLDEERKAAMVSNLLVVLCGNKDTQPIINSGTIY